MSANPTAKTLIRLSSVRVLKNEEIAPSVYLLSFRRDFSFSSGQVLGIGLSPDDDPRLYSIASGENDSTIQILYNIKPGGQLTPNLAQLRPSDTIWITPPFGNYSGTADPAWWIAAGTGLAPFRSMLRSGLGEGKTLIHGGRTTGSFYFSQELEESLGRNYIRCCSRETAPGLFRGRVTDYLKQLEEVPSGQKYYLCGSAEMVVECRDILLKKGVPFDQIVAEIYF